MCAEFAKKEGGSIGRVEALLQQEYELLDLQMKRKALIQAIEELQRLSHLRVEKIAACHLLEKTAYTNAEAIGQYTQIRHLIEQYIPLKNTDPDFQKKTAIINKAFMGLCAGRNGETKACKAALRAGSEISILQGLRLRYQGGDVEHDLVVISAYGVFTVEVKNWKRDSYIDRKGVLHSKDHAENLIRQVRIHTLSLEYTLQALFKGRKSISQKLKVYPIIYWASDSQILDRYGDIPICNADTLAGELKNRKKYQKILSKSDRKEIYERLQAFCSCSRTYPMVVDSTYLEKLIQYATLEYTEPLQAKKEVLSMMEHKIQHMADEIKHGKKDIRFKIERWWSRKSIDR